MGLLREPENFVRELVAGGHLPKAFSVLEFGDQIVTWCDPHYPARELYQALGCGVYFSVDGNGRGTTLFDLNMKGGRLYRILGKQTFDLVTDFGTGEHVFDQGQFFRTVHLLTKVGGFMVFDRPSQGYESHCFWRVDESAYADIARANSYEVIRVERIATSRGELVRGVMRKMTPDKFRPPNQLRYKKLLRPIHAL